MEPKIVQKEAFSVVGLRYRGKNEQNEIPQLWGALMQRMGEIRHIIADHTSYGLSDGFDHETGAFDYTAGFPVSSTADMPDGMVAVEVPGGTYAVFACSLRTMAETYDTAYQTWLPQSGHELGPGPVFELYDDRFDSEDPGSEFDIYLPIQ
jgi:AraC family transcriptional regulator